MILRSYSPGDGDKAQHPQNYMARWKKGECLNKAKILMEMRNKWKWVPDDAMESKEANVNFRKSKRPQGRLRGSR